MIIVAAVLLQQRFAGRENRLRVGRGPLSLAGRARRPGRRALGRDHRTGGPAGDRPGDPADAPST